MSEANAERGEDTLELAGEAYVLRPNHEALRAVEKKTGRSLIELVRMGAVGALTLDHLGIIAAAFVRAGGEAGDVNAMVDAGRMAELIQEQSIAAATLRLTAILSEAVSGGRTASGERKAATA